MTDEEYSELIRRAADRAIANPISGHYEQGTGGRRWWVPDKGAVVAEIIKPEQMPVTVSDEAPALDTLTDGEKSHRLEQVHSALQFAHDNLWETLPQPVLGELQGEIMDTIVLLNQARLDNPYGK